MAISTQKAKALCTASEFQLVQASSPRTIKSLSAARLKSKLDLARKLRDKYRDLAKKQSGEARGKRAPTGRRPAKGNDRTVEKVDLFQEVLDRFENALAKAGSDKKPSPAAKKAPAKKPAAKKSSKKAAAAPAPSSAGSAAKKGGASEKKGSAAGKTKKTSKKPAAPAAVSATAVSLAATPIPSGLRLGGGSLGAGSSGSFGSLLGGGGAQQSRETRRREKSQDSKLGREQNRFARTAQEKIQGHVGAQTRRSQAKRDSKGS